MTWIAVSGIDGTGKTGLVKQLENKLSEKYKTKCFKHPYYDWVREMIALVEDDAFSDGLIFAAGIRCEMNEINNWLRQYEMLISQRSWFDHFAYRLVQGESIESAKQMLSPEGFAVPDITILLRCDPIIAYNRIKHDAGDKYENLQFMSQLGWAYTKTIDNSKKGEILEEFAQMKIIEIDANGPKQDVLNEALKKLSGLL